MIWYSFLDVSVSLLSLAELEHSLGESAERREALLREKQEKAKAREEHAKEVRCLFLGSFTMAIVVIVFTSKFNC